VALKRNPPHQREHCSGVVASYSCDRRWKDDKLDKFPVLLKMPDLRWMTRSTCSTEVEHENHPKRLDPSSKTTVAPLAPLEYDLYMFRSRPVAPRAKSRDNCANTCT
jgi:hypothetical protein